MSLSRTVGTASHTLYTASRRATAIYSHLQPVHFQFYTMASIPSTMKGVIFEKTGGAEVLQHKTDLPVPEPKEREVLVKNDYVGVNFIDT